MFMFKIDFTRQEIAEIKSKIYLSEEEEKILDMRLLEYSITQISLKLDMSESTVNRRLKRIKNKIKRVM